ATPFIIDPYTNFSLRREGPGLLLGHGRRDEPDGFSTEIDRSLEPALIERAIHRAPVLADAELMRAWAGLYEMTPDQTGIVSAMPGVTGLHVIAGFSGHGFMHGPIAGQLMAEMLAHGRAVTMDAGPLDIGRFARGEAHVEPLTFVCPEAPAGRCTWPMYLWTRGEQYRYRLNSAPPGRSSGTKEQSNGQSGDPRRGKTASDGKRSGTD